MTSHSRKLLLAAMWALVLAGCVNPVPEPGAQAVAVASPGAWVGILVFGDGGYHLSYPDQDDFVERFTAEQYLEKEYADWLEDKRPVNRFEPRPSTISPVTGATVPATGIHAVSRAMRLWCGQEAKCDLGVMLGDNIYPSGLTFGADGADDEQRLRDTIGEPFAELGGAGTGFITYAVLGNHDWETSRASGLAQIEYLERAPGFYMNGPFYAHRPAGAGGEVEIFALDTSMLLANTTVYEDYLADDGSEVVTDEIAVPGYFVEPLTEAEKNMAQWLEIALRESTARWKIVIAHHPIWSSSGSKFEQGRALRRILLPAMCRYADALLVGHDHTLEIHSDDCSKALGAPTREPLVQVVSGAAAKQRPVNENFMHHQERNYPEHETVWAQGLLWGFAHLQLNGDEAIVRLITVPDDGRSETTVVFEHAFRRRSHLVP